MLRKEFKAFLKENGVFEEFKKELKSFRGNDCKFKDYLKNDVDSVYWYLVSAFPWEYTDRGMEFWMDLSNRWENLVSEYLEEEKVSEKSSEGKIEASKDDDKEMFFEFLQKKGAYHLFMDNLDKHRNVDNFFDRVPKFLYVMAGFNWDEVEEGADYWAMISHKWQMYLIENDLI